MYINLSRALRRARRSNAAIFPNCGLFSHRPQIQELIARAQEASNTIPTEWEGASQVSSTYVIDCVRPEDQGLKFCVSVSKNIVAQSAATVLLVNSK